jgi:uncharacterized protein
VVEPDRARGVRSRFAIVALLFLFAFPALAQQQEWPALTGRLVDEAGLIGPAARSRLEGELAAFEEKSSDQLVVATISSLDGAVLEDYANGLFRHWQLGQAQENNGVLLLVAYGDRKIRIEVGYGLEGVLTDALSRLIIETSIVPAFRQGDFEKGIVDGASAIMAVLSGDTAELEARARRNATEPGSDSENWIVMAFVTVWFVLIFGAIILSILAPMFGRKIGPGRYRWLGMEFDTRASSGGAYTGGGYSGGGYTGGGWSSGSGGGGFSGGGGSSGGGGASGGW